MRLKRLGVVAGAATLAGACGQAAAIDCSVRPIALTGTDGPLGPGMGSGVFFTDLSGPVPALNSSGQVHFRSGMTGGVGGLWLHNGLSNVSTVTSGSPQPGGGNYPVGAPFESSFNSPLLNNAGHRGWRNSNNSGLFADFGGGQGVTMLNGAAAPGTGGANFSTFSTSPAQLMTGDGRHVFRAGLAVNAASTPPTTITPAATANASGIWANAGGTTGLLVRQNDTIPSLAGSDVRLGAPDSGTMVMNGSGTLLFTSALQGTVTTSGTASNNLALMRKRDGNPLEVIARRGDAFPSGATGENYNSPSAPAINNAGTIAYASSLRGGTITGTVAGLFSDTTGSLALHARTGTAMPNITPSTGGTFNGLNWGSTFSNVSINSAGGISFSNTGISGPGVSNDAGIFRMDAAGAFSAIMHQGDVAPGAQSFMPGDTVKFGSLQGGIAHNARGQVAFTTTLSGSIAGGVFGGPGGNNSAIWASDLDGALCLIAQKGMDFEVAPGDTRTVSDANLFQASTSGNQDGRSSVFNDTGDLVVSLAFADGTSGIFLINIPSPGAGALLGMGGLLAARRRRRS
ncbi:MAG: hypothetical protein IT438_14330 [Phycisphaerales bacterium]|nr:hypothetical protein [Phycisphaerales bacterium]